MNSCVNIPASSTPATPTGGAAMYCDTTGTVRYATASGENVSITPANSFIFRPGGTAGGNVVTTEAQLVAALAGIVGTWYLQIDLSLHGSTHYIFTTVGSLTIPPGGIWTDNSQYYGLWFTNGTSLTNWPIETKGALTIIVEQSVAVYTTAVDGLLFWFNGDTVIEVLGSPLFHVTSGGFVGVEFKDQALADVFSSSPFLLGDSGSTVQLFLYDSAGAYGTAVVVANGTGFVNPYSTPVWMDPSIYPLVKFPNQGGLLVDYYGTMVANVLASRCQEGTIIFNGTNGVFSYSNGTAWVELNALAMAYTATTVANWNNTNPTSVQNALDRIAAKIGPIS